MVSVPEPAVVTTTGNPVVDNAPIDLPADSKIEKLDTAGTTMAEGVDASDLTSCCALCCIICSLYPKFPACLGCHAKGDACCLQVESLLCKVGVNDGSLCMCCKSELECLVPTTCVKMTMQMCCIDMRCAFPCDDEVPCAVTILGLTCCYDFSPQCSCGKSLAAKEGEEGGAPAGEVADKEEEPEVSEEVMDRQ